MGAHPDRSAFGRPGMTPKGGWNTSPTAERSPVQAVENEDPIMAQGLQGCSLCNLGVGPRAPDSKYLARRYLDIWDPLLAPQSHRTKTKVLGGVPRVGQMEKALTELQFQTSTEPFRSPRGSRGATTS